MICIFIYSNITPIFRLVSQTRDLAATVRSQPRWRFLTHVATAQKRLEMICNAEPRPEDAIGPVSAEHGTRSAGYPWTVGLIVMSPISTSRGWSMAKAIARATATGA